MLFSSEWWFLKFSSFSPGSELTSWLRRLLSGIYLLFGAQISGNPCAGITSGLFYLIWNQIKMKKICRCNWYATMSRTDINKEKHTLRFILSWGVLVICWSRNDCEIVIPVWKTHSIRGIRVYSSLFKFICLFWIEYTVS